MIVFPQLHWLCSENGSQIVCTVESPSSRPAISRRTSSTRRVHYRNNHSRTVSNGSGTDGSVANASVPSCPSSIRAATGRQRSACTQTSVSGSVVHSTATVRTGSAARTSAVWEFVRTKARIWHEPNSTPIWCLVNPTNLAKPSSCSSPPCSSPPPSGFSKQTAPQLWGSVRDWSGMGECVRQGLFMGCIFKAKPWTWHPVWRLSSGAHVTSLNLTAWLSDYLFIWLFDLLISICSLSNFSPFSHYFCVKIMGKSGWSEDWAFWDMIICFFFIDEFFAALYAFPIDHGCGIRFVWIVLWYFSIKFEDTKCEIFCRFIEHVVSDGILKVLWLCLLISRFFYKKLTFEKTDVNMYIWICIFVKICWFSKWLIFYLHMMKKWER